MIRANYLPYPTDNPTVEIRETAKGRGVFAQQAISSGTLIAEFIGEEFTAPSATQLPEIMRNHALQIGPTRYVHAHNRLAEIINHSCDPNCGISGKTKVTARRNIAAGEEISWDYAMTEMSDWRMGGCLCGAARCRDIIGSFAILPDAIKAEYLRDSCVSDWITEALGLNA